MHFKVKKFIKANIIPRLINGVGIIPAYVSLIIESMTWNQLNITLCRVQRGIVEFLNKRWFMPIGIGVQE